MQKPDYLPQDYNLIKTVDSLSELFNARFEPETNVILLPRKLTGDFNKAAAILNETLDAPHNKDGFVGLSFEEAQNVFAATAFAAEEQLAADQILSDMRALKEQGIDAVLRVIAPDLTEGYSDARRYHIDGSSKQEAEFGRLLCAYTAPVTQGVRNDENHPREDASYYTLNLSEDIHPFAFAVGDMWRLAASDTALEARGVLPFIHAGPVSDKPRLLLVATGVLKPR